MVTEALRVQLKLDVSDRKPVRKELAAHLRWRTVAIVTVMVGIAAPLAGRQGPPPLADYVTIGEALSSPRPEDSIEFAYRMFSVPDLEPRCRSARAAEIVRLRSERSHLQLHVGEPFRPDTLRIVALDTSGAVLPNIPLMVDVNGPENVFARDDLQVVPDGSITPLIPTSVWFRIRTICPGAGAETFVSADISPR
jgi:hypothetical protein